MSTWNLTGGLAAQIASLNTVTSPTRCWNRSCPATSRSTIALLSEVLRVFDNLRISGPTVSAFCLRQI